MTSCQKCIITSAAAIVSKFLFFFFFFLSFCAPTSVWSNRVAHLQIQQSYWDVWFPKSPLELKIKADTLSVDYTLIFCLWVNMTAPWIEQIRDSWSRIDNHSFFFNTLTRKWSCVFCQPFSNTSMFGCCWWPIFLLILKIDFLRVAHGQDRSDPNSMCHSTFGSL